jgi:acyl carrier protein
MTLNKQVLLEFLEHHLGVDTTTVDEDTALFSSGIIDSVSMVDLIVFVEAEGKVKLSPDDITLDHWDSIGNILNFVAGRQ